MDQDYTMESETRTKAVTEAIAKYREAFPDSNIPSAVLRSLARTSTVDPLDGMDRESIEKVFGGAK